MNQQSNNAKMAFQESLTRILKHSGGFQINNKIEIKQSEYQQFWDLLLVPENALQFMIELIKIIDTTEYNKKTKNYNLENLLCTLLTVCMFKKVDIEKRKRELTDAKSQWDHHISIKKQMANPYSVSIIYHLMQLLQDNDENTFIGYIIGSVAFLHDLYKVPKPENIEVNYDTIKQHYSLLETYTKSVRVKSDQFFNVLLDDRFDLTETGEYMFCYEYVLRHIKSKNRNVPRIIYDAIIKYLKMIPFIAQDFPEWAEKSVLALLHMTKQFITYFSCDVPEVLKTLLHQVEIFRRWPFPVGVMASELVQILFQECKSRCSAFRIKLREDIPDIDFLEQIRGQSIASNNQLSQQQQNIAIDQDASAGERNILQVFTFTDDKFNDAHNVLQYSQNIVRQSLSPLYAKLYSPHALRTYLIAQILSLDNKNKMTIDKQTILAGFSEQEVFQLYCKLLVILEKCDQLDSLLDINMIQDNAFEEIMKEFLNKPKQDQLNELQLEFNQIIGENMLKIPEYPLFFLQNIQTRPFVYNQAKMSVVKLDGRDCSQMIRQFIQQAWDNYLPLHTEPLRLLIVGGDLELNKVCCLLGEVYTQNPMQLRTLDVRIYLVPSKECPLAQFLAVKDPWYQRYLYLPFMEDIMIPRIDNIKDEALKSKEQTSADRASLSNQLPLELKTCILNTYLKEANRAYNVRVYKMKIWQFPQQSNAEKQEQGYNPKAGPDGLIMSTVFFCSYVMLGAAAEFELSKDRQRDDKDKLQKMTFYDYKEKNLCKYSYMHVSMTTESTDMLGNITVDEPVMVQLHYCKINNVYTDFFEGNMPMPHTDWLELSYISFENSKVFDNNLRQKNIFKKHSKENIQNAFMSLFTNLSVTKITIDEKSRKPFTVVADGKIFQDVQKIKISTTKIKKATLATLKNASDLSSIKNLNLPIMSFLPFKV